MIVERLWTANRLRNFNYLVACPASGEALAIDPLDHAQVLATARKQGWTITQVLNTHEHGDHTGGNRHVIAATGARLLAHANAPIPGVDQGLQAGDVVRVGDEVELQVLDTPGHTLSHVCLLAETDNPALFCGDTLFNAGAGNCHNGGHPDELYDTFAGQLAKLPDETLIYPGHDYLANNLRFTLDREPGNRTAAEWLQQDAVISEPAGVVTDLATEKQINTFFRLQSPEVIAGLREALPTLPASPSSREVFLGLRELRNHW
ncbi:MAG: MBL fold metallo-hydrolase [Gammaproteobacteria bacterium]|nr:MBL fold metallo-hydrolase [Gammaproteobacteria bacterium]